MNEYRQIILGWYPSTRKYGRGNYRLHCLDCGETYATPQVTRRQCPACKGGRRDVFEPNHPDWPAVPEDLDDRRREALEHLLKQLPERAE